MEKDPEVLIVLVNYKGYTDTIECLETVFKSTYRNFKVVVVDNSEDTASENAMLDWAQGKPVNIDTLFPDLVYPLIDKPVSVSVFSDYELKTQPATALTIVRTKNRGFAAANNIALLLALRHNYDFVWLLNNDTVIEPATLDHLVRCSHLYSKAGILGSKLLLYKDRGTLQGVGGRFNKWFGKVSEIGYQQEDKNQFDQSDLKFDYVIGASMFVSIEFLKSVGVMEEDFFLYYEEMDWAFRARLKGWTLGYCAQSRVYHKGGATINATAKLGNSEISDFYSVRNRILLLKKYSPVCLLTLYPAFLLFIVNRIKLKQYSRIGMLFGILFQPSRHFIRKSTTTK